MAATAEGKEGVEVKLLRVWREVRLRWFNNFRL